MIDEATMRSEYVGDYLSIGHWMWSVSDDKVTSDEFVGRLFGVPDETRRNTPSLKAFIDTIDCEDRETFNLKIERCVNDGGFFRMVYRTRPALGVQKWILAQGSFLKHGSVGRGTVQDVSFAVEDNLLGPIFADRRSKRVSSADFIRNFSANTDEIPFRPMIVTKNGRDRLHVSYLHRKM